MLKYNTPHPPFASKITHKQKIKTNNTKIKTNKSVKKKNDKKNHTVLV